MPNRYPQEVSLRDGRHILLRPFTSNDAPALWDFFQRLPAGMRRFAWDRIDDRETIESWAKTIDYGRAFPLLAFDGGRIVADATLHRRDGGPLKHVGRVKWLVDPDYRGAGLGTTIMNHFISIARANGLKHLSTLLIADLEADAITTLSDLGFTRQVLKGYGTDPDGADHDMTFCVLRL